ncbi:MAG: phosphate ABC transporter ATP-binding protein [Anaerolineae bacterium]|nr:phosphate ABC transporter ATP-binding protein [Anaerolineae bacterium]
MGPTIKIENLTMFRSQRQVLDRVTMTVAGGEIVCLLGPSGSGKSSLLRCVNRLAEPPVGTVFVDDVDVTTMDVLQLRRQVGMVFQQVALFPGTVADNVGYGAALQKRSLRQRSEQALSPQDITHLLHLADLPAELAQQDSHALSGGQAQRVAIARTLATEPSALLLDEPTSALDPASTKHVEETMLRLRQTLGLTLLWVTHNPDQARRVADRIVLLVNGRLEDEGTPEHLFREGSTHLAATFAAGDLE